MAHKAHCRSEIFEWLSTLLNKKIDKKKPAKKVISRVVLVVILMSLF